MGFKYVGGSNFVYEIKMMIEGCSLKNLGNFGEFVHFSRAMVSAFNETTLFIVYRMRIRSFIKATYQKKKKRSFMKALLIKIFHFHDRHQHWISFPREI